MVKELLAVVNDLSTVDEADREFYVEQDGQFVVNVKPVGGWKVADVENLLSALNKEKANSREAISKLAEFEGLSAREAKDAIVKLQNAASMKTGKDVESAIEEATAALKIAAGDKEAELSSTIESLTGQLNEALIMSEAKGVLAELKGSPSLIMPLVEKYTRMVADENGRQVPAVIDSEGNVRYKDGKGTRVSIRDYFEELKTSSETAPAFAGVNANGGGLPPDVNGSSGAKVMSRTAFESLDAQSKMDFTNDGGTLTDG